MQERNLDVLNLSSWGGNVTYNDYKTLIEIYKANKNVRMKNPSDPPPFPKMIFTTPEKIS